MPAANRSWPPDAARVARLGPAVFVALALAAGTAGAAAFHALREAGTLHDVLAVEVAPIHDQLRAVDPSLGRAHDEALAASRARITARIRGASHALLAATGVALGLAFAAYAVARRSVRALARSEARYRATFENAAIGIAQVALDGRWLRVNRRFARILGYEEEELRALRFQDVTHPEHVAEDEGCARRLLAGEGVLCAREKRYVRRDGRATWVHLTAALVRDPAGRPCYFVSSAEPIDERKSVEQELREAVRARDDFLEIASHELRTPLTSLRLQLEGLKLAGARGVVTPERLAAKVDGALRQETRLARLVDELLDVSRIDRGELRLSPREADLGSAVRRAVERLSESAARAGTELRLALDEPLVARFDPEYLERAVGMVLANAIKYGAGKPVDVELARRGEAALVIVRDRGIGVDPCVRERIFERFERAVSPRHYGGLGLGLFVARRVIEAHGGTISVEGAPGEGATFRIEVPLAGPEAVPCSGTAVPASA
ncbi:sensor histidine kinase KdpD [Anaeromyxobacter sp. Fw109-5]|uniref:sensor histidine kinase n=1 Tax=Anaeromyxobacter sp. (strain Fw109-5) TaxID=404589 RepID=UPI000A2F58AF|nr:HAMP domain-containing sensor histidine kinase [Anaeromyxobacter sp. Fw109-5]